VTAESPRRTNVAVPAGATRVDAAGEWSTPGLIDGAGQMDCVEIGAVQARASTRSAGNDVAAGFNVLEASIPRPPSSRETDGGCDDHAGRSGSLVSRPSGGLIWGQRRSSISTGPRSKRCRSNRPPRWSRLERRQRRMRAAARAPRLPSACAGSQRRARVCHSARRLPASQIRTQCSAADLEALHVPRRPSRRRTAAA